MFNLEIKRLNEHAILPSYKNVGDAGLDLYACEDVLIKDIALIPLGFSTSFPLSFVGIIKDRSSMAIKGLHTLAGIIDSSYRGEWKVVIFNLIGSEYEINKGDRVAQVIFLPRLHFNIVQVDELDQSVRGSGGFGSTGV